MGIAGLSNYSSTSFWYAKTKSSTSNDYENETAFGLPTSGNNNQNELASTTKKPTTSVAYSRCITANIKTEEMYGTKVADGEMVYSYKASEQMLGDFGNTDMYAGMQSVMEHANKLLQEMQWQNELHLRDVNKTGLK